MSETGFRIFNQAFSAGAELTYDRLCTIRPLEILALK